jgi:hypothetical protein
MLELDHHSEETFRRGESRDVLRDPDEDEA